MSDSSPRFTEAGPETIDRKQKALLAATIVVQSLSFLSVKIATFRVGIWALAFLLLALGLMGLRALLWQQLLLRADLSLVYPFTSLVQVLIFFYAIVLFNEPVAPNHIAGLAIMLAGIYVLSKD